MKKLVAILLIMLSIVGLSSCLGGVEFELNFVVDSETYDTVSTNGKEIVKMPSDPTKDGYTFDGWYWDKDEWNKPFTSNSLLDAPISSNMSVYAKWHVNEQDHVHTPSDWIEDVAATCKAAGSKHKECTECEAVLETIEIEKLTTHTPAEAVRENFVDSDCETEGSYNSVVYCSVCEAKISSEAKTVEKKEHTPSEWIIDTEATCKAAGSKHKECTECKAVLETIEIEKLTTHTLAEAVREDFVDSTCEAAGAYNSVVYCSVCEAKISSEAKVVEMKEHAPSEWIIDTEATCKAAGSKHKKCTECETVLETEEIEKLTTHTPADAVKEDFVDSDCETEGSYNSVVYCSVCEKKLSSEAKVVEKKEHTPSGWIEDTPATCKTEGTKHKECTKCEEVLETGTIEKLTTHTYTNDRDEACNICGEEREFECMHANTRVVQGKDATCTESGLTDGVICDDCKQMIAEQRVIPAAHKEVIIPKIEPECNNCGWTEGKECELCYKVLVEPEMIRALGCKGGDWVIKVAATEYSSGAKVKYCTRCGEQMQFENIPATVVGLNAEHSVDNDGTTYITILNAYGNLTKTTLNIPDTLWGFSVGAIADEAFAGYSNITKVVIPDSVTSIGSGAFRDCTSLKTVIIGENVNYIGAHAFTRCPLSSITFKNPNGWWMSTSSTTTSGKTISPSVVGDGVSMCKYLSVSYDDYYYRRR